MDYRPVYSKDTILAPHMVSNINELDENEILVQLWRE